MCTKIQVRGSSQGEKNIHIGKKWIGVGGILWDYLKGDPKFILLKFLVEKKKVFKVAK